MSCFSCNWSDHLSGRFFSLLMASLAQDAWALGSAPMEVEVEGSTLTVKFSFQRYIALRKNLLAEFLKPNIHKKLIETYLDA